MQGISRRRFLAWLPATAALHGSRGLFAAPQHVERQGSHIKGLSMTTYSIRQHMRWWKGNPGEGELQIPDFLDYCAKLDLDAAELTSYFFPPDVDRSYCYRVRRQAHLLGLDFSGGAMGNNFTHPPSSDVGQRQLAYARKWIDHFSDMGITAVRVFAGNPGQGVATATAVEHIIANLTEVLPYAESRGVLLGIENHDFVSDIDRLLQIVGAIDSRWLGITWDSANLAPTPDPYLELTRIAPYAITAQIKVSTHVNGEPVPADYGRLLSILREAQFRGYVVLEYEEAEPPFDAIPEQVRRLRAAIASAR